MGVRDKVERLGRRSVRDHMPEQHRNFYSELPFVLVGTVDDGGRPWASIVTGRPGFMTSPDPHTLVIGNPPLFGDPLNRTLKQGAPIGVLGIQTHTRRRNRMTGTVASVRSDGFSIAVHRTFGNCPKFIQTRTVAIGPDIDCPGRERSVDRPVDLDDSVQRIIGRADTLFVASAHLDGDEPELQGADVSHRGGKPGFVGIEDERTFVLPDFSGNSHFNTVGNILVNPRAGILFIDFDEGDLVYLTGGAEIVWDGAEVERYQGAQRLIRFRADEVLRIAHGLPLRFTFGDYSPMLKGTGPWESVCDTPD